MFAKYKKSHLFLQFTVLFFCLTNLFRGLSSFERNSTNAGADNRLLKNASPDHNHVL